MYVELAKKSTLFLVKGARLYGGPLLEDIVRAFVTQRVQIPK